MVEEVSDLELSLLEVIHGMMSVIVQSDIKVVLCFGMFYNSYIMFCYASQWFYYVYSDFIIFCFVLSLCFTIIVLY